LVAVLLLAPTAVVVPMSFAAGHTFQFPPKHWSVRWYEEFFSSAQWMSALGYSIEIGLAAAALATVLGFAAAMGLDRAKFAGRGLLRSAMMAPIIAPGIVVAVAIYAVFLRWHLNGTVTGFVLAHTVLGLPFVVISVSTSLAGYDHTVATAAASLGATEWTIFRRITLPLLAPGVLSGFVFAFVISLDEVVIALFLQTPEIRTLPVQMYASITSETDPTIAAASSLIVVITTVTLLILQLVGRRNNA
jgi:putative spermidine/putrescine transport system permease protein